MKITIMTPDIERLGEIANYESLIVNPSWHGVGKLELRINRHKLYSETLQKGNIIVVGNDTRKAFVIVHRAIELDDNGKVSENWHIIAHALKGVVGRRLTMPPAHTAYDSKSGSTESVMKHYVERNAVNPVDGSRKIPQLVIAPDLKRGTQIDWQSRFKNLAEEVADISLMSGIGWDVHVDYDTQQWVFDVYEGRDLTTSQDTLSPVIFSATFGNIQNMSYSDSDMNFRNVAIVAGQGEGVDRRVIEVGQASGLERYETFVDARDVSEETEDDEPVPRPLPDIIADLNNRGNQKLAEMGQEVYLEAQILTPAKNVEITRQTAFLTQFQIHEYADVKEVWASSFVYEEDWYMGDIVTLQENDWGVTLDARITEVTEIYEPEGFRLEAVFGQNRPTLHQKIKQELSGMKTEMTR